MAGDPYARFLFVFALYTDRGEWITAGRLAARIAPMRSSAFAKEVSRKLSNLNRFGHLERRLIPELHKHEYRRDPSKPIPLPSELRTSLYLILPDPSLCPRDNA